MKLLDEDKFNEMQTDLSHLISKIENLDNVIDMKSIVKEILSAMNNNSVLNKLKKDDINLADNVKILKSLKNEFIECQNHNIKLLLFVAAGGVVVGALIVILSYIILR